MSKVIVIQVLGCVWGVETGKKHKYNSPAFLSETGKLTKTIITDLLIAVEK